MRKIIYPLLIILACSLLGISCSKKKAESETVQTPENTPLEETLSPPVNSSSSETNVIRVTEKQLPPPENPVPPPSVLTNSASQNNIFSLFDRFQPDLTSKTSDHSPVFITNRFAQTISPPPNIKMEKFRDLWTKRTILENEESLELSQTNINLTTLAQEENPVSPETNDEKDQKELLEKMKNPDMSLYMKPKIPPQGETTISETMKARSDAKPTITILCYHQFNSAGPYSMKSEEFRQNLEEIKARGYTVIPLSHVIEYYQGKRDSLPEKSLVITIDDGYRSVYQHAYPLLKEFGYPWVFYVYSDFVNSGAGSVTWEHLKEMAASGMELGSHSKSHPMLPKKGGKNQEQYDAWLDAETAGSKKTIEEKTGLKVQTFAYPYGGFDKYVRGKTIQAGYEGIVTVVHANNFTHSDPLELNRFVITKTYSITQALNAADKNLALPLSNLEPALGSKLTTLPSAFSATLPPGYTSNPTNITMSIGGKNVSGLNYDTTTHTVSLTNLPPDLKDRVILKITAKNDQTGQKQTGTWYFNLEEASGINENQTSSVSAPDNTPSGESTTKH